MYTHNLSIMEKPGRPAQSVGHLTRKSGPGFDTQSGHILFVSPSTDSRGAVVSYWRKYVHEVLVNPLGGLSLPRKSVVRLIDRPDMTLDVYCGRKTTTTTTTVMENRELLSIKAFLMSNGICSKIPILGNVRSTSFID